MQRSEGGDYEAGGEAVARTRPKGPSERSACSVIGWSLGLPQLGRRNSINGSWGDLVYNM